MGLFKNECYREKGEGSGLLEGPDRDIKYFMQHCYICQQNRYNTAANPGLLQPLSISQTIWDHGLHRRLTEFKR